MEDPPLYFALLLCHANRPADLFHLRFAYRARFALPFREDFFHAIPVGADRRQTGRGGVHKAMFAIERRPPIAFFFQYFGKIEFLMLKINFAGFDA